MRDFPLPPNSLRPGSRKAAGHAELNSEKTADYAGEVRGYRI